jgi:hypothetical protein
VTSRLRCFADCVCNYVLHSQPLTRLYEYVRRKKLWVLLGFLLLLLTLVLAESIDLYTYRKENISLP